MVPAIIDVSAYRAAGLLTLFTLLKPDEMPSLRQREYRRACHISIAHSGSDPDLPSLFPI